MRKLPFAIFGLALLCASQASAGSTGNGSSQPNGAPPETYPATYYNFCSAVTRDTVYFSTVFSRVFASRLSLVNNNLNGPFAIYLTKTFGASTNNPACESYLSMDDAVNSMKKREASVGTRYKIVETKWAGVASPASSLATPPAAAANAQTSPPPVAQAVPDAASAQLNGQIEQAGQNVLNKLFQH